MSIGYLDEEDPTLRPEGPAEPGSADAFIDQTNAQPLAAPVSGVLPDETAFPPPVPPEAPGMVPIPPALPGTGPAPIPLAGATPPPIPAAAPSPGSIADVAQAGAKAAASTREAGKANLDALGAGQEHAPEAEALKQEQSDNARLEQADIEAHLQASKDAEAKATEAWNQAAANKKNFKFRDFYANKSTARRIGSAMAVAFGAYGASLNHTQNYALEILNKEMDDDHRNQVAEFGQLSDAEVMAKTGIADARAARVQGLTDIGARSAASDRAIAAKAAEVAQITADEQAKARLLAFGKDLEARADQTELTTKAGLYNSILKGETERAKNAETAAHTNLMNAQADAGGFAYRHGKPGSGGGGSGGHADALQDLLDKKSPAEVQAKYKLSDKALSNLMTTAGKAGTSARGDTKTALAEQRQLSKEAGEWGKQNGIPALIKKQDELSAVLEEVKNAPHNPLQQALAVEKAVSSARGGAASRQALDLALHHLGGKWDSITSMIQGARDGELGQKQMDNFIGFMTNQLGTAQGEGKRKYDEFNKFAESQPAERRAEFLASRGRLFSGLHGFGGGEGGGGAQRGPAPAGSKAGKLPDGRAAFKYPDGSVHLADGSLVD